MIPDHGTQIGRHCRQRSEDTDPIRHVVAAHVGGLLWADEKAADDAN